MSNEEERTRDEKEEKQPGRSDLIDTIGWALFLIWIGVVLLAEHFGYLAGFERLETWAVIIIGAGVLVLLQVLLRLVIPAYRKPVLGSTIFGLILLAVGLNDVLDFSWPVLGAFVLIFAGVAMILGGVFRR